MDQAKFSIVVQYLIGYPLVKRAPPCEIRRKTHCHPKYYSFINHREMFSDCSEKIEDDFEKVQNET